MTDHTPSWYPKPSDDDLSASANDHTPDWYSPPSRPASLHPVPTTPPVPPAAIEEPFHVLPDRSRRRFLGYAAAGVAAAGGGIFAINRRSVDPTSQPMGAPANTAGTSGDAMGSAQPSPQMATRPLIASADVAGRTLVVIELSGGNDGLATLVPRNAGVLYDRRGDLHVTDEEMIDFNEEFGLHPNLAPLAGHGLAALVGVGAANEPDASHFEMEKRWWAGKSSGMDLPGTGFLGRLCDQLVLDQPVTGVSLGTGPSPSMRSDKAVTVGLRDPEAAWFLQNDEDAWFRNLRVGMSAMAMESSEADAMVAHARSGLADTLTFAESLEAVDTERIRDRYPNTELGTSLGTAAELIEQDSGLRVIHVSLAGFDTHSNQRGEHNYLMEQLGESVGTFLSDLNDRGLAESTLTVTTSEFGRRVSNNQTGTDHGAAGMAFLAGPVVAGVHGEAPSLTRLDDDNLVATVDFEQYYATIAEKWFGIASSEVLESGAPPIEGIIS